MAETEPVHREYLFHDGLYSVGPIMLTFSRIVATCGLAVAIATNWHGFGVTNKLLAVLLFLHVLIIPTMIRLGEKRSGKQVDRSVMAEAAYLWIMLMAMAFAR